ncbi:MAG: DUF3570 domain-containing protein [Deltaproteobacteria bacterium]|nr:DUF3570 domain-containing protein [Deltaproteobacteria bacterium]
MKLLQHAIRQSLCALAVVVCFVQAPAAAEDRVSTRGVYYREASTRIVEPMVQVTKTGPHGVDVDATFLLDAVTSASVAAGTTTDAIFTEYRKEAGFGVGYSFNRTRVGGTFRYSKESDYTSRTGGLNLSQGVWGNTGTFGLTLAYANDLIPVVSNGQMKTYFGGVLYTQALSPTWLVQGAYEVLLNEGFLENPYIRVPNKGRESPPRKRLRHAWALRTAKYFPALAAGVQLHYRLYFDQSAFLDKPPEAPAGNLWGILGHTVELRVYKSLGRDFELRLSYRFHKQGKANFWCNTDPTFGGRTDCYSPFDPYYSADVKWGNVGTHMPEVKLTWDLRVFRNVPLLWIFAPGAADLSYARYFQDTRYGDAHLLQVGYTYPL